jgi:hypothetical protein
MKIHFFTLDCNEANKRIDNRPARISNELMRLNIEQIESLFSLCDVLNVLLACTPTLIYLSLELTFLSLHIVCGRIPFPLTTHPLYPTLFLFPFRKSTKTS